MKTVKMTFFLLAAVAAGAVRGADFELAPYFQDHMVLQRDQPLRVWGKAPTGSTVSVSFGGREAAGVFENGSDVWVATFEAGFAASRESRTLTATCAGGGATVTRRIEDAVVGDVWIAAGQSNMSYSLNNPGGPTYDALSFVAEFPRQQQTIRTIMLGTENGLRKPSAQDYDLLGGVWQRPANGANAKPLPFNFMSGVAYHFARKVVQELDVPVGIVETALNAMPASMWKVGGAFYNNHLVPLRRLTFKGALWYQGENQPCEAIVRDLTAVIDQWRKLFSRTAAELPFYAVQFPGYGGWDMTADPSGDSDPGMRGTREGIARVAATVENAYMAVVWDCGDDDNIHPLEKYHPGQRLALSALRHTYGRDIVGDSPVWQTVEMTADGKLRLGFDMGGSKGFVTAVKDWQSNAEPVVEKGAPVRGLAIAGVNHLWHWADVAFEADGKTLLVSSSACARPLYARYAYWNNPYAGAANLYGTDLLPVAPFATDDVHYRSRLTVATATLPTSVTGERTVKDALVEMPRKSRIALSAGAKLTVDGAEVRTFVGLYAANDAAVVFTRDGSLIADGPSTTGMMSVNGAKNFAVTVRDGRSTLNRVDWLNAVAGETGEIFEIVNAECHSPCQFCVRANGLVAGQRRLVLTDGADRAARLVAAKLTLQAPQLRVEWTAPSRPPKDAPIVGTLSATVDDGTVFALDATKADVPSGEVVTYPLVRSAALTCDAAKLLKNADIKVPANVVATLEASGKTLSLVLENEGSAVCHTVVFRDAAGQALGEAQKVRQGRTASVPVAPRVSGKTFAGWSADGGATLLSAEEVSSTKVTANAAYRAVYAAGGQVLDDRPVAYVWKAGWDGNWSDKASWTATGSKLGYPDEPAFASVTFGSDIVDDTIVTFVGTYAVKNATFATAAPVKLLGKGGLDVSGTLTGAAGASIVPEKSLGIAVKGVLRLANGFGIDLSGWGELAAGVYPLATFGTFEGDVGKLRLVANVATGCSGRLVARDGVLALKVGKLKK